MTIESLSKSLGVKLWYFEILGFEQWGGCGGVGGRHTFYIGFHVRLLFLKLKFSFYTAPSYLAIPCNLCEPEEGT